MVQILPAQGIEAFWPDKLAAVETRQLHSVL